MKTKSNPFQLILFGLLLSLSFGCKKEPRKVIPTITSATITSITSTTAMFGGDIASDGNSAVIARGVCWSDKQFPTIEDYKTTDGIGIGSFSSSLSGLIPGMTYYVRAYATNRVGTVYGEQSTFTTLPTFPTILTTDILSIAERKATGSGNITSNGGATIITSGVCWSTSPNPSITDNKTADGSVQGSFTSLISNLIPETTYYIRAYAINSVGCAYGQQQSFTTLKSTVLSMKFISIQGGTFNNGSSDVTLSNFLLAETELTQAAWIEVMGSNPSSHLGNLQYPVEGVNWFDVQTFISKLNLLTGKTYRLPTEAEWNYVAGGGASNRTIWAGTNSTSNLGNYAWYQANSQGMTHVVGTKQQNALGLFDMSGNVWEWCSDWLGPHSTLPQTNPTGPLTGVYKVMRGGCWIEPEDFSRIDNNNYGETPDSRTTALGFRLVYVP
jgi:formylglycine-generating enzyme required for sulfatase activity